MSTTYINREEAGVSVRPSNLDEIHVSVTTSSTHVLSYGKAMRMYFDIDSGDALDNLIEVLIEARGVVNIEAAARWTEAAGTPNEDRPDPYSPEGDEFYATHCPDCLKPNAECQCEQDEPTTEEANRLATEAVKEDADSELVGSPKEEAA